ncbi:MAG: ATP-binding protein [Fibrobacterales bacterium]
MIIFILPVILTTTAGLLFMVWSYRKKNIENNQRQSQFDVLFTASPTMSIIVNRDRRIVRANRTFAQFTGTPEGNLIGLRGGEAFKCVYATSSQLGCGFAPQCRDCATRKIVEQTFENRISQKQQETTLWITTTHSVQERQLKITTHILPNKSEELELVCIEDITTQRDIENKAETYLLDYEELYSNLQSGFAIHEMIYDDEGQPTDYRFVDVNPAFEKITGLKGSDIIGKRITEVLPNTEQYWIDTFGHITLTNTTLSFSNFSRELNKYFDVWAYSPKEGLFASIFTDISEMVMINSELHTLKEGLEQKVVERTKELEVKTAEAFAANHSKSLFLANMSHEVRTPINSIVGFTDLIAKHAPDPKIMGYINNIRLGSSALTSLIDDILDISKIEIGKLAITPIPCSLTHFFDDLEVMLFHTIQSKNIDFSITSTTVHPDIIKIDELRLRQILINLITNAIKFTNQGFVSVTVTTHSCSASTTTLTIVIADTGCGIEDNDKDSVFDVFTRTESSELNEIEGTGLGLAITKKLVSLMGGTLSLQSSINEGSTFTVTLPNLPTPHINQQHSKCASSTEQSLTEEINSSVHDPIQPPSEDLIQDIILLNQQLHECESTMLHEQFEVFSSKCTEVGKTHEAEWLIQLGMKLTSQCNNYTIGSIGSHYREIMTHNIANTTMNSVLNKL